MQEIIRLDNLSIGYTESSGNISISTNINEVIKRGTLICICGPNGGGKTTLLKTICGYIKPLRGHIYINGSDIKCFTTHKLSEYVSVVLSTFNFIGNITVFELVSIGRSPHTGFFGKLSAHDNKVINEALQAVGIESLRNRPFSKLSEGEKQKTLIAKALAQQTPIIVLDEPTAYLDYPSKAEIMRLLKKLCTSQNKTILLSSHDLEIVFSLTDYLWLIDKNLGFYTGNLEELSKEGMINRFFCREGLSFNNKLERFEIEK